MWLVHYIRLKKTYAQFSLHTVQYSRGILENNWWEKVITKWQNLLIWQTVEECVSGANTAPSIPQASNKVSFIFLKLIKCSNETLKGKEDQAQSTYILTVEYHSVCTLVGIGTPPLPLPQANCVPPPPRTKGRGKHTRLQVRGVVESQFGRLERKLSTREYWTIKSQNP